MLVIQYNSMYSSCISPLPPSPVIIDTPCYRIDWRYPGHIETEETGECSQVQTFDPSLASFRTVLKTRGDFLHANARLDACRAIDFWPLFCRALRLLATPARLSLSRRKRGRSGGWLSSIGRHRNIWLSLGWPCQDAPLCCCFECRKMSKWATMH